MRTGRTKNSQGSTLLSGPAGHSGTPDTATLDCRAPSRKVVLDLVTTPGHETEREREKERERETWSRSETMALKLARLSPPQFSRS